MLVCEFYRGEVPVLVVRVATLEHEELWVSEQAGNRASRASGVPRFVVARDASVRLECCIKRARPVCDGRALIHAARACICVIPKDRASLPCERAVHVGEEHVPWPSAIQRHTSGRGRVSNKTCIVMYGCVVCGRTAVGRIAPTRARVVQLEQRPTGNPTKSMCLK